MQRDLKGKLEALITQKCGSKKIKNRDEKQIKYLCCKKYL